jgi:hypothetical protein
VHESSGALDGDVAAAVPLSGPGEGRSAIRTPVCLERKLLAIVSTTSDTATELPLIDEAARRDGGYLGQNCHIIMHWVGRNYALAHHVTLGSLQSFLPRSNNPACSAGFAHGLVRACWYRAFIEFPPRRALYDAGDIVAACTGLRALQREGCITGASAISAFAHPSEQLAACSKVSGPDAVACVRGVPTQQLSDSPLAAKVQLVEGCDGFRSSRAGCVEWLAKALNVVTDGSFLDAGCPALPVADRRPCRVGAASWRGPLETFS